MSSPKQDVTLYNPAPQSQSKRVSYPVIQLISILSTKNIEKSQLP